MNKKELGKQGEEMIETYLIEKGYDILDENYHKRSGEIDIIAFDNTRHEIVFVEVKTRRSKNFGHPEEAVNRTKINKIAKTALSWLDENKKFGQAYRIDILAIEISKGANGNEDIKITHLENVTF